MKANESPVVPLPPGNPRGSTAHFKIPPLKPNLATTRATADPIDPPPVGLNGAVPETTPDHGKSPALDALDDSTKTHAGHDVAARAGVVDSRHSTIATGCGTGADEALRLLLLDLSVGFRGLVALIERGSARFVRDQRDGTPRLLMHDRGNPYLVEISRESQALHELLRRCAQASTAIPVQRILDECINRLVAHAQVWGEPVTTYVRIAPSGDGGIVIDVGDAAATHVLLSGGTAHLVRSGSRALFLRPKSMLPLVLPAETGDLVRLDQYLPPHKPTQLLLLAWITYTIAQPKQDTSKYVFLVLLGGEGSGKTSLCKVLQTLIDPSSAGVRTFPRNVQDLAVAMSSSHLVVFDNMRSISPPMSDQLCVASTGGTFGVRRLYTNHEQALLRLHGAVILNGIHLQIEQPDLAQRCLVVRLSALKDADRVPDDVLRARFERDLPLIMRGLYELVAKILVQLPASEVLHATRMMSFSRWIAAFENVSGMSGGHLQAAYKDLTEEAQLDAVMDDLVGVAVVALMEQEEKRYGDWSGTPTELLRALELLIDPLVQRTREWPKSPIALSKRLQSLQTALGAQGITVQASRGKTRTITLKTTGEKQ